jgi:hypothetical protein
MIYLTQARLMLESERTVEAYAKSDEEIPHRVCSQLLADAPRYTLWHVRHETTMSHVAQARQRERQILTLRAVAVEQVHRTALVRHLRENRIVGVARDQTLREFYGVVDPRESAIMEHRNYLLAASTQFCAADLLELIGDKHGLDLVRRYELAYSQYFGMFCEQARARQNSKAYFLGALMPEVRDAAERLRLRIMDSRKLPPQPLSSLRSYLAGTRAATPRSEPLDPRAQVELKRPGTSRLPMQLEVRRGNRIGL